MGEKRKSLWRRAPKQPGPKRFCSPSPEMLQKMELHLKYPTFSQKKMNKYLDTDTKRAALAASLSVVALMSYTGEKELKKCSGTIIEADNDVGIVLTSANLIRRPTDEEFVQNALADDLKVVVVPGDGQAYEGEICAFDFHYNLVAIRFKANSPLRSAKLRLVDDSVNINPQHGLGEETAFQLKRHSSLFKLFPGQAVIGIGRYFAEPYELMAAPGEFSLGCCDYDCKELFQALCRMTSCGDGGPLINQSGEVIGIAFYDIFQTPFLPINLVCKWWEHYKRHGELRRSFVAMQATNLYAADLELVDRIIRKFPSIYKGVIVEQVIPGSSLCVDDVIIECAGRAVHSFLELCEMMWDNVGDAVDLVVARADHDTLLKLKMTVTEATPDKLNRWHHWRR